MPVAISAPHLATFAKIELIIRDSFLEDTSWSDHLLEGGHLSGKGLSVDLASHQHVDELDVHLAFFSSSVDKHVKLRLQIEDGLIKTINDCFLEVISHAGDDGGELFDKLLLLSLGELISSVLLLSLEVFPGLLGLLEPLSGGLDVKAIGLRVFKDHSANLF